MGCPHEKQTVGRPGVAIVFIPHDGQHTSTMGSGDGSFGRAETGCVAGAGGGWAGIEKSGAATTPGGSVVGRGGGSAAGCIPCIPYPPGPGGTPYPPGACPYPGGAAGGTGPPRRLPPPPPPRSSTITSRTMTMSSPAIPPMSGNDSGFFVAFSESTVFSSTADARCALLS